MSARLLALAFVSAVVVGCGGPVPQTWENTFAGDGPDLFVEDDDLVCLSDPRWTEVDGSRIWNPLGAQDRAVDHARQKNLGAYPIGTVIQLFPDEVSVKRGRGFSPETNDWEFLIVDVSTGSSIITARGTTEIRNVGGTCIGCHGGAEPFDYACFTNSGCGSLPFFIDTNVVPDEEDPRCR